MHSEPLQNSFLSLEITSSFHRVTWGKKGIIKIFCNLDELVFKVLSIAWKIRNQLVYTKLITLTEKPNQFENSYCSTTKAKINKHAHWWLVQVVLN